MIIAFRQSYMPSLFIIWKTENGKISTIRCNMKVKPLKMRRDIQMRQMIFRFVLRNKRFRMNLFRFSKANINWIGNM